MKPQPLREFPYRGLSAQWPHEHGVPEALENKGNMCYRNAVFQVILHNPVVINALRDAHHHDKCLSDRCMWCALSYLQLSYHRQIGNDYKLEEEEAMRIIFKRGWASGQVNEQQDAAQFLMFLIDATADDLARFPSGFTAQERNARARALRAIFYSNIVKLRICSKCGGADTPTVEPNNTFQKVEIVKNKSLQELFDLSMKVDSDDWTCQHVECGHLNEDGEAQWHQYLRDLPEILLIQPNRFYNGKKHKYKNNTHIPFGANETIDVSHYLDPERKIDTPSTRYRLCGVIMHASINGKIGYGHYVSLVRVGKLWYECDDMLVRETNLKSWGGTKPARSDYTASLFMMQRVAEADMSGNSESPTILATSPPVLVRGAGDSGEPRSPVVQSTQSRSSLLEHKSAKKVLPASRVSNTEEGACSPTSDRPLQELLVAAKVEPGTDAPFRFKYNDFSQLPPILQAEGPVLVNGRHKEQTMELNLKTGTKIKKKSSNTFVGQLYGRDQNNERYVVHVSGGIQVLGDDSERLSEKERVTICKQYHVRKEDWMPLLEKEKQRKGTDGVGDREANVVLSAKDAESLRKHTLSLMSENDQLKVENAKLADDMKIFQEKREAVEESENARLKAENAKLADDMKTLKRKREAVEESEKEAPMPHVPNKKRQAKKAKNLKRKASSGNAQQESKNGSG